ncbi:MAG: ATP-grasp domain-containing protein [Pirellulaceae bacterium]
MRILLYEYLTGGGLWTETEEPLLRHPLLPEGRAMVAAASQDFGRLKDLQLVEFRDARLPPAADSRAEVVTITSRAHEFEQLAAWSTQVDRVMLIAPEYGGRLLERVRWVEQHDGRLLSPDSTFVELATNKTRTAQRLADAGVPVPQARLLEPGEPVPPEFPWPAVLKPNEGVGCLETHLVADQSQAQQLRADWPGAQRLEAFHAGLPASIIAICGPRRRLLLPPCRQHIASDGQFHYLGGGYPLARALVTRACQLARSALAALPRTNGFVGVDMILGESAAGRDDVVLEINPRLTTSYIGLRQVTSSNLAAALLAIQQGGRCPLFFHSAAVEFEANGRTKRTGLRSSVMS